jgi:hypothetical protein
MLRIFKKNALLPAFTLVAVFSFMALALPVNAQIVSSTSNSPSRSTDVRVGSLMNFASSGCKSSGKVGSSSICTDPATNCSSSDCGLIQEFVTPAINLLAAAFGLIAVISIILGGFNYTTSEGDPQKVSKAKMRLRNTIFAIVSFLFLYAFLNFLIPGGIF